MLAAGLLAPLRYGFGSLFVVGESLAMALLRSTGADIAGTVHRLQATPLRNAGEAAAGLLMAASSAALTFRQPVVAGVLAAGSALEAWWYGMPLVSLVLLAPIGIDALGGFTPARG